MVKLRHLVGKLNIYVAKLGCSLDKCIMTLNYAFCHILPFDILCIKLLFQIVNVLLIPGFFFFQLNILGIIVQNLLIKRVYYALV